jgi:hypothetical protein
MFLAPVTLTGGVSYNFSFYMRDYAATTSWVVAAVVNNAASLTGSTTLGNVLTATTTSSTSWTQFSYTYTPSASGSYFFGIANSGGGSYILSFDDFSVVPITCGTPTLGTVASVTSSSAIINFTPSGIGSGAQYDYYASTTNSAPINSVAGVGGTTPTGIASISGTQATVALALSNTLYYIWLRKNCGSTDQSAWVGPIQVTTPCTPNTLPYSEAITTYVSTTLPTCMKSETISGTSPWAASSSNNNTGNTGGGSFNLPFVNNATLWLPPFSHTSSNSIDVTFWVKNVSTGYTNNINLLYGTSNIYANATTLYTFPSTSTRYVKVRYTIPAGTMPSGTIYLGLQSNTSGTGNYIDDISVIYVSDVVIAIKG